MYYDLKKNDSNRYNLKEAYDIALHKCFYSYLVGIQQEDARTGIDTLKARWGKEWIKHKSNSQIMLTPSAFKRDTYDAKRKAGIDAIITFNKLMNKDKQFPIAVNRTYEVPITNNLVLTGTWEYIREIERNGDNVIQILKFQTESNKFRTIHQMNHDLELTACAMAFEHCFTPSAFELVYFDIYSKRQIISYRTKQDIELLKQTVKSVALSIQHNIRCISPSKICYHCEYRDACSTKMKG